MSGACEKCGTVGELDDSPPYAGLCVACAWLAWLTDNGKHWNNVPCVMCELGRDCDEHPDAEEAP